MSSETIEAIIGLVGWAVYTLIITWLGRRWLIEGRISDTQAAFLFASQFSIWFLYGAIVVAVESRGINGAVLFILLIGTIPTLFGAWNFRWFMPDFRRAIIQDERHKRSHHHEGDRQG